MLTISPTESVITEYVPFNINYTVSSDDTYDLEITTITVTHGSQDITTDLDVHIVSNAEFIVSGVISDVFNRQMMYLNSNDQPETVTRFVDIPADFHALYKYVGAIADTTSVVVTVETNVGGVLAAIIIQNNYASANAELVEYVQKGLY